jgi:hypothetical protein
MAMEPIVNKVAESGILSLDLETFLPKSPVQVFDLKEHLFMGLILKEKDFRAALLATDWEVYRNQHVAITCTADAIIPMWANMLVAAYLQPLAASVHFGSAEKVTQDILLENLTSLQVENYQDQRVVIKGCGEQPVSEAAYVAATRLLRPVAKSIMYGEPCSTVPIFKKKI